MNDLLDKQAKQTLPCPSFEFTHWQIVIYNICLCVKSARI